MKCKHICTIRIILCTLDVLMVGFIFCNSIFSADISSSHSLGVREFLNHLLSLLNIDFVLSEHLVRKCAHFTEFFVLALLLYSTAHVYADRIKRKVMCTLLSGLAVAVADEFIQLFSVGRSCQLSDVALDFCGVTLGAIFMMIIIMIKNRFKDKDVLN